MNFKKQFNEGLLTKNPVTVQLLGMCSTLAITTSLFNGLGMGAAVTIILICSNVLISALRKVIPNQALSPSLIWRCRHSFLRWQRAWVCLFP